jgi:hypothetical protein
MVLFDELRPTSHVSATPRLHWWRGQIFLKSGLGPGLYNLYEREISDLDGVGMNRVEPQMGICVKRIAHGRGDEPSAPRL